MLTSQNSGKYLSGQWAKERNAAMRDGSVAGDYSQEQLELSDEDVSGKHSKEAYETDTSPIDPLTESKPYDIRDNPIRGGL